MGRNKTTFREINDFLSTYFSIWLDGNNQKTEQKHLEICCLRKYIEICVWGLIFCFCLFVVLFFKIWPNSFMRKLDTDRISNMKLPYRQSYVVYLFFCPNFSNHANYCWLGRQTLLIPQTTCRGGRERGSWAFVITGAEGKVCPSLMLVRPPCAFPLHF